MGRLVPEDFPLSTLVNDAEVHVVETLRDGLTDGWLILPDVALRGHPQRQLDVVLLHEQWGIVDLEVKGHRMQLREGMWCSGGSVLAPQPGAQAKDNAYALRSALRTTGGDLAYVDVEYGLAFPNTAAIEGRLPTGLDRAQVLTATDLENPQDAIEALTTLRWHQALSRSAIEAILAVLRPDASLTWDPEARARAARSRLDDLCAMQVGALETLDGNRRVFVTGRAGTGKTRLAMGWARRAWRRDERVLLTCYNDPLAEFLRSQLDFADEDLVIGSFLQVALRLQGMPSLSIPTDADHEWWNTVALSHLVRHWHEVTERFDTVVIDEGQDFNPTWVDLLVRLLHPDGPRRILMVADDAQDLYDRGFRAPTPEDGWTVAELTNNCRNVHPIAHILRRHLNGAAAPRIGPEGIGVTWEQAGSLTELTEVVNRHVVDLLEIDERDPRGLLVATFTTSVRDALRAELGLVRWEDRGDGAIACENVHRVKGLEADTVVLASPTAEVADVLLYVGVSRAVSQLILVGPEALAARLGLAG